MHLGDQGVVTEEAMEAKLRLFFFLGLLGALLLWEQFAPRRGWSLPKWRHRSLNLEIALLNVLLTRFLLGLTLFTVGEFGALKGLGILHWVKAPVWINFIVGVLILDLAVWFQHWLLHRISFLWPLHRVHHTDLDFDATTGLRFHPLEILLSTFYKAGVVLLFGIGPWPALVFEISLNAFSLFTHANGRLSASFERILRKIFVTPDMHRIHHSIDEVEYNRNFGFCFSFWDKIFLTYRSEPALPHERMEIGISGFRDAGRLGFFRLIIQPFQKSS